MRRATFRTVLVLLALASTALAQPRNRWAPFGPGGGTPFGLAVDPREPSIVYAALGPVYRSADGGETWKALFGPSFTAVAVDPANPPVIYAGGRQLARSTNGGRTWETTLASGVDVSGLAVVPGNPSTVLAAAYSQFLRSADGGRTWVSTPFSVGVGSVVADPGSPGTAYFTDGLGLHKTTDAGVSWFLSGPLVNGQPVTFGRLGLSGGTLYLDTGSLIFRSDDGGGSWRQTGSAPAGVSLDKAFLVDPSSPSTLYLAGLGGLYRSPDSGATWRRLTGGLPQLPSRETLGFSSLAASPSRPGLLYAGTYDHGVAKSADGGAHWDIGVEPGLSGGLAPVLKIHPDRPDTFYVGLAAGGDRAFRSTDGGRTWQPFAREITRDGMFDLGFDPGDPDTLYLANQAGLWQSGDGGESWRQVTAGTFSRIAVPIRGTLVAARECGLSRSTNGGKTWKRVISCALGEDLSVSTVALWADPKDPRSLYALMFATNGGSANGRFLVRSADGGATWKTIWDDVLLATVAPSDFRTLYVVDLRNLHLLRSTDGGARWRTVRAQDPYPDFYGALAVDATDPDTLYVDSFQQGVLRSRDGGVTLSPLGPRFDPSGRRAASLLLTDRNHPGTLWVGLFNGGLFWGRFE